MHGLQLFDPDETFDEFFNSLVIIQEYNYPAGMGWQNYHQINTQTSDLIFARPLEANPSQTYLIQFGFLNPLTGEFENQNGEPSMVYSLPVTNTGGADVWSGAYGGLKIVVARPSKSLNRMGNTYGLVIRDSNGSVTFSSDERYVKFRAKGTGYGFSAPDFLNQQGTSRTYINLNAMAWGANAIQGAGGGEEDAYHLNYGARFKAGNVVDILASQPVKFAGLAYAENSLGHWLLTDI